MDFNGRQYDIKCECGQQLIHTNPEESAEEMGLELQCPNCQDPILAYESELELVENIVWSGKKKEVSGEEIESFVKRITC